MAEFFPLDEGLKESMDAPSPARALQLSFDPKRPRVILKESVEPGAALADDLARVIALLTAPCGVLVRCNEGTRRSAEWVLITWIPEGTSASVMSQIGKLSGSVKQSRPAHLIVELSAGRVEDVTLEAVLASAAAIQRRRVVVDVIMDIVDSISRLGQLVLRHAIDRSPELEVEVRLRPYQLHPEFSDEPRSRLEEISKRFGAAASDEQVLALGENVIKPMFKEAGLHFRVDERCMTANTREAHRVLLFAYREGGQVAQRKAAEAIMEGYFAEGRPPNEAALLEAALAAAGLDVSAVADKSLLAAELEEELQIWRKHVKTKCPHFIISRADGKVVASLGGDKPRLEDLVNAFALASKAHM